MLDTYKIVYSKVILQAIKDLISNHQPDRDAAVKYLKSKAFPQHCDKAGLPDGLQNALDEMLLLSKMEQKVVAQLVMEELF